MPESRLYVRSYYRNNNSCVQIIEVRVQCVVVDMHVNQSLQKRKKLSQMFLSYESMDTKNNVSNQRVSVSVTTLSFQSLFVRRTLIFHMPFYVYPLTEAFQKNRWLQGVISIFLSSYLGPNFKTLCTVF